MAIHSENSLCKTILVTQMEQQQQTKSNCLTSQNLVLHEGWEWWMVSRKCIEKSRVRASKMCSSNNLHRIMNHLWCIVGLGWTGWAISSEATKSLHVRDSQEQTTKMMPLSMVSWLRTILNRKQRGEREGGGGDTSTGWTHNSKRYERTKIDMTHSSKDRMTHSSKDRRI